MKTSKTSLVATNNSSQDLTEKIFSDGLKQSDLFDSNHCGGLSNYREYIKNRIHPPRIRPSNAGVVSTQISQLRLAGHIAHEGISGDFTVSKNGQSSYCKDFDALKTYAAESGVRQMELFGCHQHDPPLTLMSKSYGVAAH